MNITEGAIIGLLLLNLTLIILTGRAIIGVIQNESQILSASLAQLLTDQLPGALADAAQEFGNMPQTTAIQQIAIEWMRSMMNKPTIDANVVDLPRDQGGKFSKIESPVQNQS